MTKLIAVAGSQGTGKSTLIRELGKLGYQSPTRKTSRSILQDWGVTLDRVNTDKGLACKFQDEILARKLQDDMDAKTNSQQSVVITERSFADLFVYGLITLGSYNKYSSWLNDYYYRCKAAQSVYDGVVYLSRGYFDIEHDGIRSTNDHYSRLVATSLEQYTTEMTNLAWICTPPVNLVKRVECVGEYIKSLEEKARVCSTQYTC